MSLTKTTPFDAANYIDNEEDAAALLLDARKFSEEPSITQVQREAYVKYVGEIVERVRQRWSA